MNEAEANILPRMSPAEHDLYRSLFVAGAVPSHVKPAPVEWTSKPIPHTSPIPWAGRPVMLNVVPAAVLPKRVRPKPPKPKAKPRQHVRHLYAA